MRYTGFARILQTTALAAVVSTPAWAAEVEVMHWWTSGGEQAAVSVFANEFNAQGDTWVDTAIAGGPNARAAMMQRTLGGDPPDAAQFNPGRQYEELIEAGLLLDLTDLAEAEGWADVVRPSTILDPCIKDGHVWCVPVNIHSWQWGWASIPVFEQSGVEMPSNLDEFLAAAPAIQEAGFIPFAIGGESWQHSGAMDVVILSTIGKEGYLRLYQDRDLDYARGPEVAKALETWRALTSYIDDGSGNRNWNDTTNLVITDQAALQIMGDWARGEFAIAGEVPGEDYECLPGGPADHAYLDTGGDEKYDLSDPKRYPKSIAHAHWRLDNVVAGRVKSFEDLGIRPVSMEGVLPEYLWRFRPSGQYAASKASARYLKGGKRAGFDG